MRNIIPFKKEIVFKTQLSEITSISLENTLHTTSDGVSGDFIVSGEYKISKSSNTVESFNFNIPFDISLIDNYDISEAIIDIDDFYYEIINESILAINIDVCIDKLKEKEVEKLDELFDIKESISTLERTDKEDSISEQDLVEQIIGDDFIKNEEIRRDNNIENKVNKRLDESIEESKIKSLFQNLEGEKYAVYKVYIVRQGDTIENIKDKYSITEEELGFYNDLSDINVGDKIIIPVHEGY